LCRRLDDATAELFERHYLECDECFIELRAGELLVSGLERPMVERRVVNGVLVLRVAAPSYLTEHSTEVRALCNSILEQKDIGVLVDLSRVSRVDSSGLRMLMHCYSRAIRNSGALKLLNPSTQVSSAISVYHRDGRRIGQLPGRKRSLRNFV
jgi:anti-anti-sigma factor